MPKYSIEMDDRIILDSLVLGGSLVLGTTLISTTMSLIQDENSNYRYWMIPRYLRILNDVSFGMCLGMGIAFSLKALVDISKGIE